jgi:steroid 5-alpha reductase family enzyme/ligand-binding SRPBCC domain-containing protein
MTVIQIFGVSLLIALAYMTVVWLLSLVRQDASVVDVFWGLGFALLAVAYFLLTDGFVGRKILIASLVGVWGLRLSLYILWRNWGKGEDFRYRAWRERAGERFWWTSYLQVFLLQGLLLWAISAPLLAAQFEDDPDHFTAVDLLGTLIWGVGFFFEAVGDYQMARFKGNPANKGKVMRSGLWGYTRHPNYFGDATLWWGYFVIAAGTQNGYWSLFGPILMSVLLLRVSGVALLERTQVQTKPQYKDYIASTSAFVPWFPRFYVLERSQLIPAPLGDAIRFFEDPRNLAEITPGWLGFEIVEMDDLRLRAGVTITYRIRWLGFRVRWRSLIAEYEPGHRFVDVQTEGPYHSWHHEHVFEERDGQTLMHDRVRYKPPFGVLGDITHAFLIGRQLRRIFDYRAARIREVFASR